MTIKNIGLLLAGVLFIFPIKRIWSDDEIDARVSANSSARAAVSVCTEAYVNDFIVDNIFSIPTYVQADDRVKRDAMVCFAAGAAQALDINRYRASGEPADFVPSSPLLLAHRFYHLTDTHDGVFGGSAESVVTTSFRMANCNTLVNTERIHQNGNEFSVIDELNALAAQRRDPTRPFSEDDVFAGRNGRFFNSTYQYCQPGNGSALRDTRYSLTDFRGLPTVSEQQWQMAFSGAKNSSLGSQVVILSLCSQVLRGQSFHIRTTKDEDEQCGNHVVVAIGRRCRCGNDCQVLIRDSYRINEAEENQERVNAHDIWISERVIRAGTQEMSYISGSEEGGANPNSNQNNKK